MNKLLEIFGRAISVDTADLIWHWLNAIPKDIPDSQLAQLEQSIEMMGNMELDKAREGLEFYLYENPDCVFARMAAAAICIHCNELEKAMEQLQSIYMRQPSNTMALYAMGYCNERLNRTANAAEFYQDCLKFKSHLQLPRQRLAAIYFKQTRIDKAILEYELLTTEHPDDISSMVLLGYLYITSNHFDKAVDTFNTAILAHPDNFNDQQQEDDIQDLVETGNYDQAIEHVQNMIENIGQMPDLYVRLGDILSRADRGAEAISYYENALRLQPNYLEASIKLGTHYLKFNREELAALQFNRAMEINDEIVDAYIGLAIAHYRAGQEDEAFTTISLASSIQQNSTLLFSQTAMLHLKAAVNFGEQDQMTSMENKPQELLQDVIKAHQVQLSSTPKSPDCHYKLGLLMISANDIQGAINSFQNALDINPTHHRVKCKMALCLYELGQKTQAMESLIRSESLDAMTLDLHYKTALLFCDKQKFAKAMCQLQNSMKENFTEPDALINIEVVLENLGLVDRTNTTWERLTETARNALNIKFK